MTYEETDGNDAKRTLRPIPDERIGRFPERLEIAIGGQSVRSFARACGLSETVIRKYLSAESLPTIDRMAAIAVAAGVRVEWLLTGEDPKESGQRPSGERELGPVDRQRLYDVVEVIEEELAARRKYLDPAKKAELIVLVYEEIAESEEAGLKYNKEKVVRLVNLAS